MSLENSPYYLGPTKLFEPVYRHLDITRAIFSIRIRFTEAGSRYYSEPPESGSLPLPPGHLFGFGTDTDDQGYPVAVTLSMTVFAVFGMPFDFKYNKDEKTWAFYHSNNPEWKLQSIPRLHSSQSNDSPVT